MSTSLDFILLNIGYAKPNEMWNWYSVLSPFARVYYVKEGEARVRINGTLYELKENKLYLIPPFTQHDNECDGVFAHYYIHFYEKSTDKESIFDKYTFPVEVATTKLHLDLIERLLQINPERDLKDIDPERYDNPPTFSRFVANSVKQPIHTIIESEGILYQLIANFFAGATSKQSTKDIRIVKALEYIHRNTNNNITITELANIACVTEDHFIRIFKKCVNQTPIQYINQKKIESAQLLLISTNKPIRSIANELSIDNISYFNKLFKQHTNLSPSGYRGKYKE